MHKSNLGLKFRSGLVCKAHRPVHQSTLGLRVRTEKRRCSFSPVGGGPVVLPHDVLRLALVDHGLDREHVPRLHHAVVRLVLVVQDLLREYGLGLRV